VTQTCRWCGRALAGTAGAGRPRLYCKQACRQRDYEARRRAAELGLGEHELVVTRAELEGLRDRLFMLERTVEDAEADLRQPEARRVTELRRIMEYVLASARECVRADESASSPGG
jgi:chromosome segregation ATPase